MDLFDSLKKKILLVSTPKNGLLKSNKSEYHLSKYNLQGPVMKYSVGMRCYLYDE